jgi:hypothetical protein
MTAFAPGDRVRVITLWSSYRGKVGLVVPDTDAAKRDGFLAQTVNVSFEGARGMRTDIMFFPRELEMVEQQTNGETP